MYNTCPKCGHERQSADPGDSGTCPSCGVVYEKWLKHSLSRPGYERETTGAGMSRPALLSMLAPGQLLSINERPDPVSFAGRALCLAVTAWLGWRFIMADFTRNPEVTGTSLLHTVNLVFHEAGHVLFMPFGEFISILGGTLGQLLMPLVVMLVFLFKEKNNFAASIGLWWLGQSFVDCAPYIDDAKRQQLMLLGGFTGSDRPGAHDWNNILFELDILDLHRFIAHCFDTTGSLLMIMALLWAALLLRLEYRAL